MKKRKHFTQLTIEEREHINERLRDGASLRTVATELGRNHSTLSRELKKNCTTIKKHYTPRLAQKRTELMRRQRGNRPRLKNQVVRDYVEEKLKDKWSPEQIAGRLPKDRPKQKISHEAIYQYVYSRVQREGWGVRVTGEDLRPYLRRSHKRRKRKYLLYPSDQGRISNRISIEQRPKYIEKRRQLGHWESDSMKSKQSATGLNTLVERVTGLTKIKKITDGSAAETRRVITFQLTSLPEQLRRTITSDNGKEHADHESISRELSLTWYFCHPYSSHERGTNENTNGLVRDYLPKKTDFALVPNWRIQEIEDFLNDRPRKRLKYKTPREVFNQRGALIH